MKNYYDNEYLKSLGEWRALDAANFTEAAIAWRKQSMKSWNILLVLLSILSIIYEIYALNGYFYEHNIYMALFFGILGVLTGGGGAMWIARYRKRLWNQIDHLAQGKDYETMPPL